MAIGRGALRKRWTDSDRNHAPSLDGGASRSDPKLARYTRGCTLPLGGIACTGLPYLAPLGLETAVSLGLSFVMDSFGGIQIYFTCFRSQPIPPFDMSKKTTESFMERKHYLTNGLAIFSLISAILAVSIFGYIMYTASSGIWRSKEEMMVLRILNYLVIPLPFIAVVLGHMARTRCKRDHRFKGKRLSLIALVLGYACLLFLAISFIMAGVDQLRKGTAANTKVVAERASSPLGVVFLEPFHERGHAHRDRGGRLEV